MILMDMGGDVESVDSGGWTPLHCASAAARACCVSTLLAKGADPAATTPDGYRPSALIATVSFSCFFVRLLVIVFIWIY